MRDLSLENRDLPCVHTAFVLFIEIFIDELYMMVLHGYILVMEMATIRFSS